MACSGSDPVDLEEYYIEWKLNFGREFHTLDTLDFREGLGGFPSLFLLALLRSFHGRCDAFDTRWLIDRRSFSTNMFEGRHLTYVDFMSMVLLHPVPCPYLIVYVAEHCIDVRGTELEWMNGCTIDGVHMTIVAFTVKSLGHLSACVDDAELSKFDIPVIQDVFADAEMILVSLRAERYGPIHDVPPPCVLKTSVWFLTDRPSCARSTGRSSTRLACAKRLPSTTSMTRCATRITPTNS